MFKLYKQLTKFADSMFKMIYIKFWVGDYKVYYELTKKLDIINPNWIAESPQNTKEYLELLIKIYSFGFTPKKFHKSFTARNFKKNKLKK